MKNHSVRCRTESLTIRDGPRPRSVEEAGASPNVFAMVRESLTNRWQTFGEFLIDAFLGGATALLVPTKHLAWLSDAQMGRLRSKYGEWGDDALVFLVRNTAAPAIQNAAEPAGGMAETTNLLLEQLKEIVEVGVYREDGWVRFLLPESLAEHQREFDTEQEYWWKIVRPDLRQRYEAPLTPLAIGDDQLDDRRGVLTAGPVGDFSLLSFARLELEGSVWRLCDTECTGGSPEWIPLRRTVMVVVPRPGKSPIGFHFGPDGELHPSGIHIALSGETLEYNLTHIGRAALKAMEWIE